jgi:hypothetical protein
MSSSRPAGTAIAAAGAVGIGVAAALVIMLTACDRKAAAGRRSESSATPANEAAAAPAPRAVTAGWNDTVAGPDLFVAGANSGDAVAILPRYTDSTLSDAPTTDSVLARKPRVDLFARRGAVGPATLTPDAAGNFSGSCTAWPTAHVTTPQGPPPDWSVAFVGGHAAPLPMDSVAALSSADSARRAAAIAHAASALPNDTAAAFRGLPFAIRDAHRFTLPSGDTVIAAEVVRRLNQEANPQEEHLIMILERDTVAGPNGARPPYVAAYSERTSGPEEDVETSEVLAAVVLGRRAHATPAVVIGRDYGDGSSYTLLERTGPRRWRARWNSAYVGC